MKSKPAVPPASPPDPRDTPLESDRDQISQNIEAVLGFYTREEQKIGRWQRILERISGLIGQPAFLGVILLFVALWMLANTILRQFGRVEFDPAKLAQYGVGEHPERDKEQNDAKKGRLPDKTTDAFEDPLPAADLLLFTRVELQNGLDILADLVAIGFEWRVPGIRRRRGRNGRFGFHQGMLLDPAGPKDRKFNGTPGDTLGVAAAVNRGFRAEGH